MKGKQAEQAVQMSFMENCIPKMLCPLALLSQAPLNVPFKTWDYSQKLLEIKLNIVEGEAYVCQRKACSFHLFTVLTPSEPRPLQFTILAPGRNIWYEYSG